MASAGYPFGIDNIMIYPLSASDVAGTGVPLPASRVLEFTPNEDEVTLSGGGGVVARQTTNVGGDVSLEHGGISLPALAALTGGTVVQTGSTPNITWTLDMGSASVSRPYVMIVGRALEGTGDWWMRIWKVNFNLPAGAFNDGEFTISSLEGGAIRNLAGKLYSYIAHETATAISAT